LHTPSAGSQVSWAGQTIGEGAEHRPVCTSQRDTTQGLTTGQTTPRQV